MRHLLMLATAAAALAAMPAVAHQRIADNPLNCPSLSRETRMQAIESRIETLESRLETLDSKLESFDTDRRDALEEAKTRIEQAAHDSSMSQGEIDKQVAAALAQADARAKSATQSASAAHAEIKSVKAQMQGLQQQLHALARGAGTEADKAG